MRVAATLSLGAAVTLMWRWTDFEQVAQKPAVDSAERREAVQPASATRDFATVETPKQYAEPLWRSVDERTMDVKPAFEDEWSEVGRVLVDVSGAVTAAPTWRVGDRLVIDLPQIGERYESVINHIDDGLSHSRSVRGLMVGADGQSRRLVVTVGPTRVFAYIDTAEGPYELVADTRLGWLLPSSSMMAGFDYSKPDYLLPETR